MSVSDWTPATKPQKRSHKKKRVKKSDTSFDTKEYTPPKTRVRLRNEKKNQLLVEFEEFLNTHTYEQAKENLLKLHPSVSWDTFKRWTLKPKRQLIRDDAESQSRTLKRSRVSSEALISLRASRFGDSEDKVFNDYLERRSQGRKCSTKWFKTKMKTHLQSDDVSFTLPSVF